MSSFRHPVGPERPGVYWRRRALAVGVLVVIALIVVLIVLGFGRGGASSAAPESSRSPSSEARGGASDRASDRASAGASASSAPSSAAASGSPSASAGAAASGEDGDACSPSQITLTPITDKTSYGATEDPQISMSIENTGTNSCHMDLGSSQQVLTIFSGTETYWTSKDCQTGGTNQDVTIKAGQKLTTPAISWDRTRSSSTTCNAARPSVTAGGASYHLQVSVGKVESSATAQFILD